jgi:predicted nucleic acid-binding protein
VRVFLDTNVLASALATRGLCADLFESVLAEHELVASKEMLEELERALTLKFKVPGPVVKGFLALIVETAETLAVPGGHPQRHSRSRRCAADRCSPGRWCGMFRHR